MTVGERIQMLRKQRRLTLEEVGSSIDVGRSTISRYENGQISIPIEKIEQLAQLFNVSPAFMMGWTESADDFTFFPRSQEAKMIAQVIDRLTTDQRKQALNVIRAMFPQYARYFH